MLVTFVVALFEEAFFIYMHSSWGRGCGLRIIRTRRGVSGDRAIKNLQSTWSFVRKFDFFDRVTVYPAGDADLRQFDGVIRQDLEASPGLCRPLKKSAASSGPQPAEQPVTGADQNLLASAQLAGSGRTASAAKSSTAAKPPANRP